MKIKVLKTTIFVVFAVMAMLGCKKQPVIYANHDITACGVDDPLVNLQWLAKLCDEAKGKKHLKEMTVILVLDTVTQENAFKVSYAYSGDSYRGYGYNCSGEEQYRYWSGGCLGPDEGEFNKNKIGLGTIYKMVF